MSDIFEGLEEKNMCTHSRCRDDGHEVDVWRTGNPSYFCCEESLVTGTIPIAQDTGNGPRYVAETQANMRQIYFAAAMGKFENTQQVADAMHKRVRTLADWFREEEDPVRKEGLRVTVEQTAGALAKYCTRRGLTPTDLAPT